jgi:glucuronoarabinoxylan endo-1,4-beta-xylanase
MGAGKPAPFFITLFVAVILGMLLKKTTITPNGATATPLLKRLFLSLALVFFGAASQAQTTTNVVDQFNPSGTDGFSYANGQIDDVWANWFGTAFQSATWDSTSDANNNPNSGSLKIVANFSAANSQYEIYDGLNGLTPPLSGVQYTNFQCDVRFAAGSALTTNGGVVSFGNLQFGVRTASDGQDYFGSVDVPATTTNWVHVSVTLNATTDTNLLSINDVLLHIYGPYYSSGLNGASTLWVDNIEFVGAAPVTNGNCTVDWNTVYQRIDGFGASSAWNGNWTTAQADLFFSTNTGVVYTDNLGHTTTNTGVGLSLLRNHIVPASSTAPTALPSTVETSIMQMAQARGARVWSTPWTPAPGFKSNDTADGGGMLGTTANYQAYASQQANYVASMKTNYGVNLYALSIQNEPDAQVTNYESCNWSAQQIHDFTTNLYNALSAKNLSSTLIMLPESQNWQDYSNLAATAMSDPVVAADVGIVADHNYDGTSGPASLAKNSHGKALWETEVSLLSGSDSSITNGVYYAQRIFLFMTNNANAFHYWWLITENGTGNQGLLDASAAVTKRLFAFGQYSRFVRPNYYRINAANTSEALITAYQDTNSGNFAIVAVNTDTATAVNQTITLTNFPIVSSVTPWITTSNLSLASQATVTVTNASFSYTLPPLSVITFVGNTAPHTAPTLAAVPNETVNAGTTVVITNVAMDAESPPLSLSFHLLAAPTNATLTMAGSTNAIFTWRPLVSQAGTINSVSMVATDNGTPNLSATNTFNITVNPVVQPVFNSLSLANGKASLVANGMSGPDYSLLVSTDLLTWQLLFTTNSPSLPVTLVDPNLIGNARFYRLQIGP